MPSPMTTPAYRIGRVAKANSEVNSTPQNTQIVRTPMREYRDKPLSILNDVFAAKCENLLLVEDVLYHANKAYLANSAIDQPVES
jgi:hypothetical protein